MPVFQLIYIKDGLRYSVLYWDGREWTLDETRAHAFVGKDGWNDAVEIAQDQMAPDAPWFVICVSH